MAARCCVLSAAAAAAAAAAATGGFQAFTRALELDPSQGPNLYLRGTCQLALGKLQSTVDDLDRALACGFAPADVFDARGRALELLGKFDEAISDFTVSPAELQLSWRPMPRSVPRTAIRLPLSERPSEWPFASTVASACFDRGRSGWQSETLRTLQCSAPTTP
ncbi:MAG: tetratricopeptide repeat protein, partial [Allorhizobium sp.]